MPSLHDSIVDKIPGWSLQPRGGARPQATLSCPRSLRSKIEAGGGADLAVDLSLGPVRPHEAACQIEKQLKLSSTEDNGATRSGGSALEAIGQRIDAENTGYLPVKSALDRAERVARALYEIGHRRRLFVILPIDSSELGAENEYFLKFLAERCRDGLEVFVVGSDMRRLGAGWDCLGEESVTLTANDEEPRVDTAAVARHFPGVVEPRLRQTIGATEEQLLIRLGEGLALVPPSLRRSGGMPDETIPAPLVQHLRTGGDLWLMAYVARFDTREADLLLLLQSGLAALAAGSDCVGLRLLEAAKGATSRALTIAQLEAIALAHRIANEDFAAAAVAELPAETLPARLRGQILQSKAWGLAMSGRPQEAMPLFEVARTLLYRPTTELDGEYLYLRNITALSYYRGGNLAKALEIEGEIRNALEASARSDVHMDYINSINTARLHLADRNVEKAEQNFQRAFRSHYGLRTLVDHLTVNIYNARLAELRGDTTGSAACWLNAAIFWISASAPESISERAARLVVGGKLPDREQWVAALDRKFTTRLEELFSMTEAFGPAPCFATSDLLPADGEVELVAQDGWLVIVSDKYALAPLSDGDSRQRLRATVHRILALADPTGLVRRASSIFIDDQFGREIAGSRDAVLAVAARLNARRVMVGDEVIVDPPRMTRSSINQWYVRWSEAVLRVQQSASGQQTVIFRRYRPARILTEREGSLLEYIQTDGCALSTLVSYMHCDVDCLLNEVRQLERERIVFVTLITRPDDGASALVACQSDSPAIAPLAHNDL